MSKPNYTGSVNLKRYIPHKIRHINRREPIAKTPRKPRKETAR